MRILILLLLLAVSAMANFGEAPDLSAVPSKDAALLKEEPRTTKHTTTLKTTTPQKKTTTATPKATKTKAKLNPLPYGKEISKDILKFAENLLKETLHLKTNKCNYPTGCFPLDLSSLAIEDLVAIKAFLKHVYDDEFDKIMAIPSVDDKVWSEYLKIYSEMHDTTTETVLMWNNIWEKLENKTVFDEEKKKWIAYNNGVRSSRFLRIHGIEEGRKALERLRKVFDPALNSKSSEEALGRAIKSADFLEHPRLPALHSFTDNELNDNLFDKEKEAKEIEKIIRRLYNYLHKTDPAALNLYAISFTDNFVKFSDLSLRTLIVFKFYLLESYGSVLKDIPLLPMTSTAERTEKMYIVNGIQKIWNATIDAWITNFDSFIQGDYKKDPERVKQHVRVFTEYLGDFLDLSELRLIHQKALAVLGKGFDVIKRNPRLSEQSKREYKSESGSKVIEAEHNGNYIDKGNENEINDGLEEPLENIGNSVDIFVDGSENSKDNN